MPRNLTSNFDITKFREEFSTENFVKTKLLFHEYNVPLEKT